MRDGIGILIILIIVLFGISNMATAQAFPEQIQIIEEGQVLKTGGLDTEGFYDETKIPQIYLEFSDPDFWDSLFEIHESDAYLKADMNIDGIRYEDVGVQFKGNTSFRKVRDSVKYSFNISLDYLHEGQDIEDYNTLNLNNAYGDPTFIREVLYLHQIRNHIPAAKGNFAELYLNGESWGLYANIQQINKDYLEEWFLSNDGSRWRADKPGDSIVLKAGMEVKWGKGFSGLNYLGDEDTAYQQYYTLKSTDVENPWSTLVRVCDILNNTPLDKLEDTLNFYMDIDRTLWFLAAEIAFSDDDSYVFKGEMDYYIYVEPETGRLVPLEFDGNTVMNIRNVDWSPFMNEENSNYPLLNRLLAIPSLRQRYLAHFRTILSESLDKEKLNVLMESYFNLTEKAVLADEKKIYTNTRYFREIGILKKYITDREQFLNSHYEIKRKGAIIDRVSYVSNGGEFIPPNENEEVNIVTLIPESENIEKVNLYYSNQLSGRFSRTEMLDVGNHPDGSPADGIYGALIPGNKAGTYVRFYIEAVSGDSAGTCSYSPAGAEHNVYFYQVSIGERVNTGLVINELLASNDYIKYDEYYEFDDWVELFNQNSYSVSLDGYHLSDKIDSLNLWELSGLSIDADGYLSIWLDDDDEQGILHTNFKLSAGGEQLILSNPDGTIADMVSFRTQTTDISFGRYPNGTGEFYSMLPTFNSENLLVNSVPENDERAAVVLYPNPVKDRLYISTGDQLKSTIVLVDILGKELHRVDFRGGNVELDVSFLPGGMYIFRISGSHGNIIHSGKVLITK